MKIKFYSYTPSGNVKFESEGIFNGNTLSFIDKSYDDTTLNLTINEDNIHLTRVGKCNMNMHLEIGRKHPGHFKNQELEFDFVSLAQKIEVLDDKITLMYEMFINEASYGVYKIFLVKK